MKLYATPCQPLVRPRLATAFRTLPAMLVALLMLMGCGLFHRGMQVSVPVMQTAAEQYRFAVQQREQSNLAYITDPRKLAKAREVIRQTLAQVQVNFPDDRKFTPLARMDIIEMDAGLDHRHAARKAADIHKAVREFGALADQYPEYEFIQARSLYNRGLCYKELGEFKQAMDYFRQVRDKYLKAKDPMVAGLGQLAGAYYNNIYVQE